MSGDAIERIHRALIAGELADDRGPGAPVYDAGLASVILRIALGIAYLL